MEDCVSIWIIELIMFANILKNLIVILGIGYKNIIVVSSLFIIWNLPKLPKMGKENVRPGCIRTTHMRLSHLAQ